MGRSTSLLNSLRKEGTATIRSRAKTAFLFRPSSQAAQELVFCRLLFCVQQLQIICMVYCAHLQALQNHAQFAVIQALAVLFHHHFCCAAGAPATVSRQFVYSSSPHMPEKSPPVHKAFLPPYSPFTPPCSVRSPESGHCCHDGRRWKAPEAAGPKRHPDLYHTGRPAVHAAHIL